MPPSDDPKAERHSLLTGKQILHILERCNVNAGKFRRDTGLADANVRKLLRGDLDGDIPRSVDATLRLYLRDDEARKTNDRLFPAEWIEELNLPDQ